jgi:TRAP-type transport system periplasmic protein
MIERVLKDASLNGMKKTTRTRMTVTTVLAAAIVSMTFSGCSGAAPAASSSGSAPITLTFAHIDNDLELDPTAQDFIDLVESKSHGQIKITFVGECCGRDANAQEKLVAGVAKGDFDLGWRQVRGLENLGVTSFQALYAPRLIDSYAAEANVLKSDVAETILPGLDDQGVTALALEPGALRRPIANGTALVEPANWSGFSFWSYSSKLSEQSISALGAASTQAGNDDRDDGLSNGTIRGAENSVAWQAASEHVPNPVLSINEALWPRISVLIANPKVLKGLTAQQLKTIREAAKEISGQTAKIAKIDSAAVADICSAGGHFAVATDSQLAATDVALAPIYAELNSDATTAALITKIKALKPATFPTDEYSIPATCLWK